MADDDPVVFHQNCEDRELPDTPMLAGEGLLGWDSGMMHQVDVVRR